MKKTTIYSLIFCLVGFLSTEKALAQDLFECELDITLSATGTCDANTGTITVDITGGFDRSYTIHWSNQYSRTHDDTKIISDNSYTITGLPPVRHTVVVTDNDSNCRVLKQVDVVPNYVQGAVKVTGKPAACSGYGVINVTIEGNDPYYYVDLNGPVNANYIAHSNDFNIYKLTSGDYEVVITQKECIQTFYTTVGFSSGLPSLILSPEEDECGIHSGAVDFLIEDGTGPYKVELDGPTQDSFEADGSFSTDGLQAGSYTATLTDAEGCVSVAVLTLNTNPLSATVSTLAVTSRGSGFLKVHTAGGYSDYIIAYSGPVSGSRSVSDDVELISVPAGDYEVTVTDGSGCSVSQNVTVSQGDASNRIGGLTVNPLVSGDNVIIHQNYPNPFSSQSTIRFELPQAAEVMISVQDHFGRVISLNKQSFAQGLNEFVVNGTDLSAGMYFYTISTDGFNETKRMIVQ